MSLYNYNVESVNGGAQASRYCLIRTLELMLKSALPFCSSAAWVNVSLVDLYFVLASTNFSFHQQGINLLDTLGDATDLLECLNDELPSHELLSILD